MGSNILKKLLHIEFLHIAKNLGFTKKEPLQIEYEDLKSIVSESEKLSRHGTPESKEKTILLIALCWEYCSDDYKDSLREIFIIHLSRIGFSPSTILLDSSYIESKKYRAFNSYFNQLNVAITQQEHTITINNDDFILSNFQKQVWDASKQFKYIAISAPTSAGKSFIIYLRIIQHILSGYNSFVYIVPTISLINQVTKDLSKLLKRFNLSQIKIFNNISDNNFKNRIYILTQERLISFFNEEHNNLNLAIVVVDEIQNIERVANDDGQRSKILYDVLKEIDRNDTVAQVILSGPGLKNIGNLSDNIFKGKCHVVEDIVPPVLNITYSISYEENGVFLKQYTSFLENQNKLLIDSSSLPKKDKVMYDENFHNFLSSLIKNIGSKPKNIIFSPTPDQARKTAIALYLRDESISKHALRDSLSDHIKNFVHSQYDLANTVKKSIAYHSGSLPLHIRSSIENAFIDGIIDHVVCTTTLMQGVNFPASNVIIRNPNLFIRRNNKRLQPKLSDYEFSNLRGRAGRLLKEFIGRTIVLNELTFLNDENNNDFENTIKSFKKEITVGYADSYRESQSEIEKYLISGERLIDGDNKYLLTHIRNTLYRNSHSGIKMLREVGIRISPEVSTHALSHIEKLSAPRDYIIKNRYWDPHDLNYLYHQTKINKDLSIPTNIWSKDLAKQLSKSVIQMAKILPYYFKRYISKDINDNFIYSVCISATQWCRETPLKNILEERDFTQSDDLSKSIDDAIKIITRTVSYGLPMLLKPLSELNGVDSNLLSSIENGAYSIETKNLINQGIPRDTAIYLNKKFLHVDPNISVTSIIDILKRDDFEKHYWVLKQIEHLGD
ncbi:DEAD/DEAH box helicase [Yersinia enterocolitica]|uniref:DEAD/DEAH box helicase n=1 Tax=Yersinia enterocolitica TaxID=630 RepID=UPI001C60A4D2|nr:DEAD/DEAH box helicase [Yersinia enterocolitica]MBW5846171.1 DEAD/DEAH box helicase [Yersinia enterocolitica]MBW5863634.1 DEAD/DEAH box helicase [Yersinia enterocolitica]